MELRSAPLCRMHSERLKFEWCTASLLRSDADRRFSKLNERRRCSFICVCAPAIVADGGAVSVSGVVCAPAEQNLGQTVTQFGHYLPRGSLTFAARWRSTHTQTQMHQLYAVKSRCAAIKLVNCSRTECFPVFTTEN